jgi:septal ring-binding cell division protein DamX
MDDLEKNINEQKENQSTHSNIGDEEVFLLNKIQSYPEKFPVFPSENVEDETIHDKNEISDITDHNNEEQPSIWETFNFNNLEPEVEEAPKIEDVQEPKNESYELDEDFKKFLSEELEHSAKKKESKKQPSESVEFVPVEEKGKYELIDLDKFANLEEEEPKQKEKEKRSIKKDASSDIGKEARSEEKQSKIQEENNEKKRRIPLWIMITSTAIVLMAITTFFSYNAFKNKQISQISKKSNNFVLTKPKKEVLNAPTPKVRDTVQLTKKEEQIIDTAKEKNITNLAPIPEKTKKRNGLRSSKQYIIEKKIVQRKPTTNIVEKPKKESKQIHKKPEKTILAENRQNYKEANSQAIANLEKAVYTIQVYSTPSRDDAEIWKKKLESLNIPKAYISEQKIRDIIWYRVRFGEFPTKEAAIQAAKTLGFSQMWIDRIK